MRKQYIVFHCQHMSYVCVAQRRHRTSIICVSNRVYRVRVRAKETAAELRSEGGFERETKNVLIVNSRITSWDTSEKI